MKFRLNIFGIQLILRITLICLLSLGLGFSVVYKPFFFIPVVLIIALCVVVINLYFYLIKTNENLSNFLLNLKHQDFQTSFPKSNKNGNFIHVNTQYNEILKQFEIKQDAYKHQIAVLKQALEDVKECVLVYKQNGDVVFINHQLQSEFQLNEADSTHIDLVHNKMPFPCFTQMNIRERKWVLEPKDYNYLFTETWHVEVKNISAYNTNYKICFFSKEHFNQQQNIKGWLSFVKVISHEIGNGITPIRSIAETLAQDEALKQDSPNRVTKGLGVIVKQSDELLEFSERYRQLVQLPELTKVSCTIAEILDDLHAHFQYVFTDKLISFTYSGDLDYVLFLDKQLIKQMFNNLLVNSIWAIEGKRDAKIGVQVTKRKNDTLIEFEDNGKGIPNDKKYQIFIPFYTSKQEGSGIGLSLVQQIIWKHNGRIFVESEHDQFTRFIITLND